MMQQQDQPIINSTEQMPLDSAFNQSAGATAPAAPIQRPDNAFMRFVASRCPGVSDQLGELRAAWRAMDKQAKIPFVRQAAEARREFRQAIRTRLAEASIERPKRAIDLFAAEQQEQTPSASASAGDEQQQQAGGRARFAAIRDAWRALSRDVRRVFQHRARALKQEFEGVLGIAPRPKRDRSPSKKADNANAATETGEERKMARRKSPSRCHRRPRVTGIGLFRETLRCQQAGVEEAADEQALWSRAREAWRSMTREQKAPFRAEARAERRKVQSDIGAAAADSGATSTAVDEPAKEATADDAEQARAPRTRPFDAFLQAEMGASSSSEATKEQKRELRTKWRAMTAGERRSFVEQARGGTSTATSQHTTKREAKQARDAAQQQEDEQIEFGTRLSTGWELRRDRRDLIKSPFNRFKSARRAQLRQQGVPLGVAYGRIAAEWNAMGDDERAAYKAAFDAELRELRDKCPRAFHALTDRAQRREDRKAARAERRAAKAKPAADADTTATATATTTTAISGTRDAADGQAAQADAAAEEAIQQLAGRLEDADLDSSSDSEETLE